MSATRSSHTLLKKGSVPPRATSQLPPQSSIYHAIFDDVGGDEPDSSLSSSSESSSSDLFTGCNLFQKEPGSDHSSDSSHTKQKKCDCCQKHHAKITELKYQHTFLKNDPPFKYNGELQAGLFKKWVCEVQDWCYIPEIQTELYYISELQTGVVSHLPNMITDHLYAYGILLYLRTLTTTCLLTHIVSSPTPDIN